MTKRLLDGCGIKFGFDASFQGESLGGADWGPGEGCWRSSSPLYGLAGGVRPHRRRCPAPRLVFSATHLWISRRVATWPYKVSWRCTEETLNTPSPTLRCVRRFPPDCPWDADVRWESRPRRHDSIVDLNLTLSCGNPRILADETVQQVLLHRINFDG